MLLRPQVWATRLIASVVLRTKTHSRVGGGVDEGGDEVACRLVLLRGGFGELVDAAVDVGVEVAVVVVERVDHSGRLLGAGGAVEVDERPGVGGRAGQEREVVPDRGGVECWGSSWCHCCHRFPPWGDLCARRPMAQAIIEPV